MVEQWEAEMAAEVAAKGKGKGGGKGQESSDDEDEKMVDTIAWRRLQGWKGKGKGKGKGRVFPARGRLGGA
jgi:hypothetical protein